MTDGGEQWMVVHHDIHGTGGIVRENLSEREAREMVDAYERLNHHQSYAAHAYTEGTRTEVMSRERILA